MIHPHPGLYVATRSEHAGGQHILTQTGMAVICSRPAPLYNPDDQARFNPIRAYRYSNHGFQPWQRHRVTLGDRIETSSGRGFKKNEKS